MKKALLIFLFSALSQIAFADNKETGMEPVTEIIVFKVSDPVAGIKAVRAIVEDARAFNNAIISSEVYQSASDPNIIAQRITWKSLEEAKSAFAASEKFPSMPKAMKFITEQMLFDHFYQR